MKVKLKGWRKERDLLPTFVSKLIRSGGACVIEGSVPAKYEGKIVILTVIDPECEDYKELIMQHLGE